MKPAHCRVTFEGIVGPEATPLERWSFNLNFPHDTLAADSTDFVTVGTAAELSTVYSQHLQDQMPQDVILTRVKIARVDGAGHVELRGDGSYNQGTWDTSLEGFGGPNNMPLQTALCVSLKTARAGSTGKGRFFLPWPSILPETSSKRLSVAGATLLAGRAKDFLNGCATVCTFAPQVVSSKGYMSEVIGVRLGRAPDTLRSRREDLPEDYVNVPLQ